MFVKMKRKSQRGDGMMRLKLILTATLLCLAGPAAIAQELAGTLEKIRNTGIIAIGHRESSIPFSYYDKNEKVVGYGMDLCYLVADAVKVNLGLAKLEIKLVPITPSLRIPFILSEKIDLACETITNNLERQKVVAFSTTYFVAANRFVSKVATNLRTLDDLKGKTVVSTIASTNLKQITELNAQRQLGLTILAAKDNFEAFRMLESDRAAAVVMDDILLYSLVANSSAPADYVVSDDALSAIYRNGDIDKIYAKWFLNPIPPNGISLNVPMSVALKRVIERPTDSGDSEAYA